MLNKPIGVSAAEALSSAFRRTR